MMKDVVKKMISRFQLMLIILFVLLLLAAFATAAFSVNTARIIIFGIMLYVIGIILYLADVDKQLLETHDDSTDSKGEDETINED